MKPHSHWADKKKLLKWPAEEGKEELHLERCKEEVVEELMSLPLPRHQFDNPRYNWTWQT